MRSLRKNQNQAKSRKGEKTGSLEVLCTCLNNNKAQAEVLEGHKEGEVNAVLSRQDPEDGGSSCPLWALLLQD